MSIQDELANRAAKLAALKPTSMDGIKRLAKSLKKHYGILHHVALNRAAVQAGYQNYQHARNQLVGHDDPA